MNKNNKNVLTLIQTTNDSFVLYLSEEIILQNMIKDETKFGFSNLIAMVR